MTRLNVIQPGERPGGVRPSRGRSLALRLYRVAVLVLIAWIIYQHHVRLRVQGDAPIVVSEVRALLPDAAVLVADDSTRRGLFVYDSTGNKIGYALRTSPVSDSVIGYSGSTDTLVVLDNDDKVIGIRLRSSHDTHEHVHNVTLDDYFMKGFDGRKWNDLAELNLQAEGIEGVSGATMTSMAVADGLVFRSKKSINESGATHKFRWDYNDIGLAVVVVLACLLAFTHLRGKWYLRRGFQILIIGYVGFYTGDLIAQSLLAGWAASGAAWRTAPGLVVLVAAALIVPWTTRRQLYCSHICPFGAAQELVGKLVPWRVKVPHGAGEKLRWLPPLLLVVVILTTMLGLPINLASLEPFDAFLVRDAGWATIVVALLGLAAAAVIPQAYCKYGCPTGALLDFTRSHGHADHFSRRDAAAGLLLILTASLYFWYVPIHTWILSSAAPW
ncbi:MAG: 4Fe-4S binding protein [Planctomycetes bacterium]|nr:4Fe-4S binding protein [Planctomycetota bacterium]